MGISVQECPLCRTPLSETRFAEVQATIREEEQARFTSARQQMEHEFAQRLKTETAAAVQRAKVEGQKANDALVTERGQMAEKISQLEAREVTFQADRSKAIATLKADFDRKLRQQAQDAEKRAKDASAKQLDGLAAEAVKLTKQVAALEQAKGEVEAAKKKSEQETERNVRKAATDAQRVAQLETEKLRATLDKHREAELIKQRGQFAREREAWQQKISDLSRKLEHKTAHELGEFPEIDLHGALRDAFSGDKIRRVAKGEPGADVIHQVIYRGEICGTIVLDSKNHKGWQNSFVDKLRRDQLALKADHAVLATSKFPQDAKDLAIRDGVIVTKPTQVVSVVSLLRDSLIKMHQQGLSTRDRGRKKEQLYTFITSDRCRQQFDAAEKASKDLQQLEVEDYAAHESMRRKRGVLFKSLDRALRDLTTNVASIVEADDSARSTAATRTAASDRDASSRFSF